MSDHLTPETCDPQQDILSLDRRIRELGLGIWIGAEPTFTDRFSESPEWLSNALGGDKEQRACALLRGLLPTFPGAAVLHTLGRQYPGEPSARWNMGLYARRDGTPAWSGPPDPAVARAPLATADPDPLMQALARACDERGWDTHPLLCDVAPRWRLLVRPDTGPATPDAFPEPLLHRPSVHTEPVPETGLMDPLSHAGHWLLGVDRASDDAGWLWLELPWIVERTDFLALLELVAGAANRCALPALRLRGHPPPVDRHVAWTTLTPDPAVIEANLAPAADLEEFLRVNRQLFIAADSAGLSPYRLQYNGRQSDSGGGGQITIGGPKPDASPFFLEPQLLPRLVRYFNHHPALSYWLAPDYVGSGSQAPRADESPRERFLELAVALEQLEQRVFPDPQLLWSSLAPFLADAGGNSHRSEINVEKLWNPGLGERGHQGLVELRPFRMAPDLATLAAEAALAQALTARLMQHLFSEPLCDWGDTLHARFALPYYLIQDLSEVLADLESHGLGLGPVLTERLLDDSAWEIGSCDWNGLRVRILRAHEFWPLIGDFTSQRPSDSRLVDASTARIELRLCGPDAEQLDGVGLSVNGYALPLRREQDGLARLAGIRYRSFVPWQGLHPAMPAQDRIELRLTGAERGPDLVLCLHDWRPDGSPYDGLPKDLDEALRRRRERLVASLGDPWDPSAPTAPPGRALSDYCLDLRRV
jgi:uncharacterized protein (DUF2126 family)